MYSLRTRVPRIWKKFTFTDDEWKVISRIVADARQRYKYSNSNTRTYYIEKAKRWRKGNKERDAFLKKERRRVLKLEAFSHYGGSICAICGQTNPMKLLLDHKNRDGRIQREKEHLKTGKLFYLYLKRHDYPQFPVLQVLCKSCHTKKTNAEKKLPKFSI